MNETKKIILIMCIFAIIAIFAIGLLYNLVLEVKIQENKEKLNKTIWIKDPQGNVKTYNASDFTELELMKLSQKGYQIARWNQ